MAKQYKIAYYKTQQWNEKGTMMKKIVFAIFVSKYDDDDDDDDDDGSTDKRSTCQIQIFYSARFYFTLDRGVFMYE